MELAGSNRRPLGCDGILDLLSSSIPPCVCSPGAQRFHGMGTYALARQTRSDFTSVPRPILLHITPFSARFKREFAGARESRFYSSDG